MKVVFVLFRVPGFIALSLVAGCWGVPTHSADFSVKDAPTRTSPAIMSQQFMIKFKSSTTPCDAQLISRFSSATKIPLDFVRVMSGHACVIRLQAASEGELSHAVNILRQHPEVEWLEQDVLVKPL